MRPWNVQKNRCVPCKLLRQVRELFRTAGRPRWDKLRLLACESFLLSVCKSHACATRRQFVSVDINDPESGTEITDILQVYNPVHYVHLGLDLMLAYHRFLGFALLLPATTASSSLRPLYCLLGSAAYGADGAADVAGSKPCKGFQLPGCTWLPVLLLSSSHCWRDCRRSSFLVRARAAPPTGCTTHVQPSCGLGGRALLRC